MIVISLSYQLDTVQRRTPAIAPGVTYRPDFKLGHYPQAGVLPDLLALLVPSKTREG